MSTILEIDNVLSQELCKKIIEKFERDYRKMPGQTLGGIVNITNKKTTDVKAGNYSDWFKYIEPIEQIVNKSVKKYLESFGSYTSYINHIFKDIGITRPLIQKYEIGDYFNWHTDYNLDSQNQRILGYIIYLNTLRPGDGGETEFINGKKILPVTGKIIIFPSNWDMIHRGAEVKKGVKYIMTGFINCNVKRTDFPFLVKT
jgi:hypothetical protein